MDGIASGLLTRMCTRTKISVSAIFIAGIGVGTSACALTAEWRPVTAPIDLGHGLYEPSAAATNPSAIQRSIARPGRIRFNLRLGEHSSWDDANSPDVDRAELSGWSQPQPIGRDIWLSYSMRILPGDPLTSRWCAIGQMHATTDPGDRGSSAPFAMFLRPGDRFEISTRSVASARHTYNPEEIIRYSGQIERNRWYSNVFRLRFGYRDDAILQWWRDGVLMLDLSNFSMGYNDQKGPYWQFGAYRNRSPENFSIEYDNVEISSSSLLDRTGRPPPAN